jgi:hypothetical protein
MFTGSVLLHLPLRINSLSIENQRKLSEEKKKETEKANNNNNLLEIIITLHFTAQPSASATQFIFKING